MTSALDRLAPRARQRLRPREQPEWTAPMLAVLTDERFSDPGWIYERKLDGERCLAFRHGNRLRLLSRTRKPLNDTYPELVGPLEAQHSDDFIVDGEIVAFEGPRTSFERLQRRIQLHDPAGAARSGVAVFHYLFDILHLDGNDTADLGLRARKSLLRNALTFEDLPRQKVNYHLRELERHGLVRLVEERRKGNVTERLLQATAAAYVISPAALASVAPDPARRTGCRPAGCWRSPAAWCRTWVR